MFTLGDCDGEGLAVFSGAGQASGERVQDKTRQDQAMMGFAFPRAGE